MCNIAGYVGKRAAAPILIEMMKKQEGLAGGYYTGIATIHEGKIYYAKLEGDTDRLVALTNAAKLPGNIGIIHSRSRSGGPGNWSHPFMHYDREGNADLAYVANGAKGVFDDFDMDAKALAEELTRTGYPMPDAAVVENNIYLTLDSGVAVHMSDVMCQLIARNIDRGDELHEAMHHAFYELPSEIVGLILSLKDTEAIAYARYDTPMTVAFASHGAYLASAYFSMPSDACEHTLLPAGSYGKVYADHFVTHKMPDTVKPISPINATVISRAYAILEELLSCGTPTMKEIVAAVRPVFDDSPMKPVYAVSYEVLGSFMKEGRLVIEERRVESDFEGIDAPEFHMSMKK